MNTETKVPVSNLRYVRGVGPKRALALEKLGITSVHDLLYFFPRRYEDRSCFRPIGEARAGETVTLRGNILSVKFKPIPRMPIVEILVGDDTGIIPVLWFNQPYLRNQFAADRAVILYGKVEMYQNRLQMVSPEYEFLDPEEPGVHAGRITPVYPLTEGLFQRSIRTTLYEVVQSQLEANITDYLDEDFRRSYQIMDLPEAVRQMHFPVSFEKLTEARRRIVFDEFFLFEISLLKKIEDLRSKYQAHAFQTAETWGKEFAKSLPFTLTKSQNAAFEELAQDLKKEIPMNRLLMGDVGSGKTIVAAFALGFAARNHHQGALLVPTEILAEQHYQTLNQLMSAHQIPVALLTSSTPAPKRERLLAELKQGKLSILVGTHAMLQEDVKFKSLGLVVIDEQHKFGVYQRCRLLNDNPRPHQLVMTATPIPRTLALTIYGDLDVSTLRELPSGRKPITTYWITREKQDEVLKHMLERIQKGEQAYFIFPLIEDTEKTDLLAAKKEYERLKNGVFSKIRVGLIHGKLTQEERDQVMKDFKRGEIGALVSTSVIEVGVDNPNATMMVIENAERFGLAQLHQMRGRIGRGAKESSCFLFGEPKTDEGKKRLRILTKTQDGFLIAEEDLKLRGPGDFWGSRQSGESFFRVAHPILDQEILDEARKSAMEFLKTRGMTETPMWRRITKHLEDFPIRY